MAFDITAKAPGVYIQEIDVPGPIAGVGTSTAAFVGPAERGPIGRPVKLTTLSQFTNLFGGFIAAPPVYATHAVHGFFRNGGSICYFLRVGTGKAARRVLLDRASEARPTLVVTAKEDGRRGEQIEVTVTDATPLAETTLAREQVNLAAAAAEGAASVSVAGADVGRFRRGDQVLLNGAAVNERKVVERTRADGQITFTEPLANAFTGGATLRIADLAADQRTFRVAAVNGLSAGSHVRIARDATTATGVASQVDPVNRIVTLEAGIGTALDMAPGGSEVTLQSIEFDLEVVSPTETGRRTERRSQLGMDPRHPNYVGRSATFTDVDVAVAAPPSPSPAPHNLPATVAGAGLQEGVDDRPGTLTGNDYKDALASLAPLDDISLLCIPDAAALPTAEATRDVQQAMIDHCSAMEDRFAILDPLPGRDSAGIEAQRDGLASDRGFAALYYPGIVIGNPLAPGTITVPPSGHLAGLFADTDTRVGVFKAPANAALRGVLGLERVLIDAEQGPLNEKGINVLRAFSGRGVVVWGARTVSTRTQWRYVSIRRLLLFIEQSVKRGTQFAVFEPNTIGLRQRVVRQVREFLLRQWQAGALVGATPDEAFRVRADEELNPPDQVALGILTIEVIVAPAPPAEFVVFRVIQKPGGPVVEE